MTIMQYRAKMLLLSTQQAELLCELMDVEGIKKEPEQVRKNVATILSLLTETEAFLENFIENGCPSSTDSISDERKFVKFFEGGAEFGLLDRKGSC